MYDKRHKGSLRVVLPERYISGRNGTVCAVNILIFDRHGYPVLPPLNPKAVHNRRSVRQFRAGRDNHLDSPVFNPKVQTVIKYAVTPLYRHIWHIFFWGGLLLFQRDFLLLTPRKTVHPLRRIGFLPNHPHIIFYLFKFMQIVMVYGSPSCHRLVGV